MSSLNLTPSVEDWREVLRCELGAAEARRITQLVLKASRDRQFEAHGERYEETIAQLRGGHTAAEAKEIHRRIVELQREHREMCDAAFGVVRP